MKIIKVNEATPIQTGMLFQYMLTNDKSSYMGTEIFHLKGTVRPDLFREVLDDIAEKYEVFRSNIVYEKMEKPKCIVMDHRRIPFRDFPVENREEMDRRVAELKEEAFQKGFDLQKEALVRIDLIRTETACTVFFAFHHIFMDGYCAAMLADIIMGGYGRKAGREGIVTKEYLPFSVYQDWLAGRDAKKDRAYWKERLNGAADYQSIDLIQLASDREKKKGHASFTCQFDREVSEGLAKKAAKAHTTLNMCLQWLWGLTLCRNAGSKKAAFGTVASFRPAEIEHSDRILGPMINTIPVLFDLNEEKDLCEELQKFGRTFAESMNHSWIGLGEIQKTAEETDRLFNHIFVYDNFPEMDFGEMEKNTGFQVEDFTLEERTEYGLTLEVSNPDGIRVRFNYDTALYSGESIRRLAALYQTICAGACRADRAKDIPNVPKAYEEKIEQEMKDVQADYQYGDLIALLKQQVAAHPYDVALEWNELSCTYEELDRLSDRVAELLYEDGLREGARIGVDIISEMQTVLAMIGIMKLGACYIPFDVLLPEQRLEHMITDADITYLLGCGSEGIDRFGLPCRELTMEVLWEQKPSPEKNYLATRNENSISNIMFTSGTTSKPKGVIVRDGGILGLVLDQNYIDWEKSTCQFQNSSMAFDAATYEIWGGLLNGKRVVMIDRETLLDANRFQKKIDTHRGCSIFMTTSLFQNMVDQNPETFQNAYLVLTGGEQFSEIHGRKVLKHCPQLELRNMYGPTECTAYTSSERVYPETMDHTVPIGLPIKTRGVMICDDNGHLLPDGIPGEICIFGQGLAEGYCGDPKITEAKFVYAKNGVRYYKSGDFGYRDPEGHVYFCKRRDQQLKLRGYRISIEEIEEALRSCRFVRNAAVVAYHNREGGMFLTAYLILEEGSGGIAEQEGSLTTQLKELLPYYMIPSEFIQMEQFPINANGKMDRKKLPVPDFDVKEAQEAETETEQKMLELFRAVIPEGTIGVNHAFIKAGGDSIKAMKLTGLAKKAGYALSVADLYREQTPKRLAGFLDARVAAEADRQKEIKPDGAHRYDPFPLNNVQVAYLSGRSRDLVLGGYGTVFSASVTGDYEVGRLTLALQKLIKRHDMLRARIYQNGTQQIERPDAVQYEIPETDIRQLKEPEQERYLSGVREKLKNTVFEPGSWPMFSIQAVRTGTRETHLFLAFDALIMDAFSAMMMAEELKTLYEENTYGETLELSFRDYILETAKRSDLYEKDKRFWMKKLDTFPLAPDLKFKTPPEKLKKPEFQRKHRCFGTAEWTAIRNFAREWNITPAMLICGLYAYTLSLYSGQSALSVNLTVFSREAIHPQVDEILGDFTKIVLMDYDFKEHDTFRAELDESQKRMSEYLTHLHFDGIDFMRELARIHKPVNGRPLMPVVFTSALYDTDMAYDFEQAASRTPQVYLDCQAMLQRGELHIVWDYPKGLFEESLVDAMFTCFGGFLHRVEQLAERRFPQVAEIEEVFRTYNDTTWEHRAVTLQELVEEALSNPYYRERIWLKTPERSWTFGETDREVRRYASHFRARGVGRGDFVCVEGDRTAETVFAILGVVRAGAAYIPVQPAWPGERKENIRALSGATYWYSSGVELAIGDDDYPKTSLDDPAYVIYTSGSTGKPKGVRIRQGAVTNTLLDINDRFGVGTDDTVAAVSSFSFDLSVYDIFGSLQAGAGFALLPDMKNIHEVISGMQEAKTTIWNTVPALMGLLVSELSYKAANGDLTDIPLRVALLSGDWIPTDLPDKIRECFPGIQPVSLGGATEASIWSVAYDIPENSSEKIHIPYGYPLRNQSMYILSESLEMLPPEVEGDIYIGGIGLADEYQANPKQTESSFLMHDRFGRIYKTGDFGYLSKEGFMEFCGRKDNQVKVNGLRIELGDIDSTVKTYPGIADSVSVVMKQDGTGEYLATYVKRVSEEIPETTMTDLPLEALRIEENHILQQFDSKHYETLTSLTERFALASMGEALVNMGVEEANHTHLSTDALSDSLGVAPNRRVNIRQWLGALKESGVVSDRSGAFFFDSGKLENPDVLYEELLQQGIPDYMEKIVGYLVEMRGVLVDVLRGKVDPMRDLFFRDGQLGTAVNVYRNSITGLVYGSLAAEITAALAAGRNPEEPFRILEVGAGVGGTTDYIIPRIRDHKNVEYVYTDMSDVFLDEAKKRYADFDFITYQLFDINRHPRVQNLPLHSFDLIIGANVFHDAHDIDAVMESIQILLSERGRLMILEATVNTAAQLMTAGFIEGLTAYEDDRRNTDLPAYNETQWCRSLEKSRYTKAVLFPQDTQKRKLLQTSIILTQTRQKGITVDETRILAYLKERIPDYMLPKFIIEMQQYPLSEQGKVDRKKLPQMKRSDRNRRELVKPANELQKRLAELWAENLGVEEVGVTDNYFALGGDSLKAIRLMSRVEEAGYRIGVDAVFRCTTILDMESEILKNQ